MNKATLTHDFLTDDEFSFGVLIKKGSEVLIKGSESNGTCYVEYIGFGFSVNSCLLNVI